MAAPDRKSSQRAATSGAHAESSTAGSNMQLAARAPSNQATLDVSRLVSALQVTDVRFDLRIYGPFFTELPRRLGRNRALDASARALATAFPSVHTHKRTPDMYKAYGEAIGCLRESLGDPALAGSVETLCAVYLVLICQVRNHLVRSLFVLFSLPPISRRVNRATRGGSAEGGTSSPATARPSPTCSTPRRRHKTGRESLKPS